MIDHDAQNGGNRTDRFTPWALERQIAEDKLAAAKAEQERRQLLAAERLETIKAQQALIAQLLSKGEAKPLEGKTEIDEKAGYIAEQVAYSALNHAAKKIVETIQEESDPKKIKGSRVLIVDQLDYASSDLSLLEVASQLEVYESRLSNQIAKAKAILGKPEAHAFEALAAPAAFVLPLIASALPLVADIVGYFRTDYVLKGRVINLKKEALISAVASRLKKLEVVVYVEDFRRLDESSILKTFADLTVKAVDLRGLGTRLLEEIAVPNAAARALLLQEIRALKQQMSELDPQQQNQILELQAQQDYRDRTISATQQKLDEANAAISETNTLLEAFQQFSTAITAAPNAQTYPKLFQAALRAKVKDLEPTHILYLQILSSGGEVITRRKLFGVSGVTSFVGGLIACYVLAETNGHVISSRTVSKLSRLDYHLDTWQENNDKVFEIAIV